MIDVTKRLDKVFANSDADAIVVMNTDNMDSNFRYLTGFSGGLFEQGILVAERKRMTLLVSKLEYGIAASQKPKGMEILKVDSARDIWKDLKALLKGKTIGFNSGFLPYSYYKLLKKHSLGKRFVDSAAAFEHARVTKDGSEIRSIGKANEIVKKALSQIEPHFKEGMTEKELTAEFDFLMAKAGADEPSFESIVAFDKNSALPHHMPDDTKLRRNSIVLIDVGAKYNNYCSDVTRSFVFKPDKGSAKYKRIMDMYATVKGAQEAALKAAVAGAQMSSVHNAAERFINTAHGGAYKGKFIHSLGHSIGIDVHDSRMYALASSVKFKLERNMVFSDEPGVYITGFGGIRIEDDILITDGAAKMF